MSSGGCVKKVFVVFNFLFWVVGLGILGYVGWTLGTMPDITEFLSGTLIFTYSLLGVGVLIAFIGLLGCIGGCSESTCCLKTYIGLMTMLLFIDIGVAVGGYAQRDELFNYLGQFWTESNQDTKNHIQQELYCCGYDNYTEYSSIPSTCYSNQTDNTSIYTTVCRDALSNWIGANIPVWASILGSVAFIQIISILCSCATVRKVKSAVGSSDID